MNAKRLTELLGECWHEWSAPKRMGNNIEAAPRCIKCDASIGFATNRTFDNGNDVYWCIGKMKEMGVIEKFSNFLWELFGEDCDNFVEFHKLSETQQCDLILEFMRTIKFRREKEQ